MKFISKIISLIMMLIFGFTIYMIYKLNILPLKYFVPITFISLLVFLFLEYKLLKKKSKFFSRFFYMIVAVLVSSLMIYLLTYINATYDFMNSLVFKDYEIVTYDIVVKRDSNYKNISDLKNKSIGYLETDKNYKNVKMLMKANIAYDEKKISDVDKFAFSTINEEVESIVIEENRYNLLKEEYPELGDSTDVIKTYKVIVKKEKASNHSTSEAFIMYISGIDNYGKISGVSRSDVNILVVVNPNTKKIMLVSIPRDYYVNLYGTNSKDKLTHAGMYGIDTSVKSIEDLLDIDIQYYLRLNFSTLTKSIDLIGGVDVYSDRTFTSYIDGSMTINEGVNHMDGKTALAFARERHAYETGDRHRGENQQAIIKAVIEKMSDGKNITKFKDILSTLEGTFETSMSYKNITDLVKMQLDKNIKWDITSISLDGRGSYEATYSMGSRKLYVMIPDDESVESSKNEINKILKEK